MDHGMWNKRVNRRAILGGIAGGAAAAILAACGGSKATDTPKPAGTTAATTAAGTGTSPTTAAGSAAATRPAGSAVAGSTAPAAASSAPAGTTAAASTTAGTGAAAYSPQGTKVANFADKQILRIATADDPKTLDPAVAQYSDGIGMIHMLYDSLFSYDDKGNLIPRAALAVPTPQNGGVSSDGKTYTVKIKPGQKFSDGSPITAKDYVYAAKRFVDPTLASNYSSFMSNVVGYEALNAKGNNAKSVADLKPLFDQLGVSAKDDTTLEFKLTEAQPTFPFVLSLWGLIPLKQSVIDAGGATWWNNPKNHVTNGAWIMESFQSKQKITMIPNPNYTGERPFLQRVEISVIADAAQTFNAYQNNELDMVGVPRGNRQQVLSDPNFKEQIIRGPSLTTWYLAFNNKRAPFDNPAVRKAFSTAFDRETFIKDVNKGVGKPAYALIAPGEPGASDSIGQQYKFDAAKAKKILTDAGIDPKTLTGIKLLHSTAGDGPTTAQAIQAQIKQNLGIDVQLDPVDSKTRQQLISDKHDYQFTMAGWGADYPDPENWLPELFGSKGGNNDTQYSNPKVDDLLKQAKIEQNNDKRLSLYDQAQKILIDDDAGIAPMYYAEVFALHKKNAAGITPNPMDASWVGDQHAFRGIQFTK